MLSVVHILTKKEIGALITPKKIKSYIRPICIPQIKPILLYRVDNALINYSIG
jgi:hypothetical protein